MSTGNLTFSLVYLSGGSLGIVGNLLIVLAILGSKPLRRSKCSVLLSFLGITDLATSFGNLIMGLILLISPNSTQSRFGCLLSAGSMLTGNQMSAMLILLVSLDRLVHLHRPESYRFIQPIPYYFACVVVTTAYAAFMMSTPFMRFSTTIKTDQQNSSISSAVENRRDDWWFEPIPRCKMIQLFSGNPAGSRLFFTVHCLTAGAVLVANLVTMTKLNHLGRQVEANGGGSTGGAEEGGHDTTTTHEESAVRAGAEFRKKRLIKSIMVISLVYVVTWVLAVVTATFVASHRALLKFKTIIHMFLILCVQVDDCSNVFIYAYMSQQYRWEFERWTPDVFVDVFYFCFAGYGDQTISEIHVLEPSRTSTNDVQQRQPQHQNQQQQQQQSHLETEN